MIPKTDQAPYVCNNCKLRKKRCDKRLPSCTFCTDRAFVCDYVSPTTVSSDDSDIVQHASMKARRKPRRRAITLQEEKLIRDLTPSVKSDILLVHSFSDQAHVLAPSVLLQRQDSSLDSVFHRRVSRLIQTTGLSIDEIYKRYLEGLHKTFPLVSLDQIMVVDAPPSADNSILLLAMCLITLNGASDPIRSQLAEPESIYLTTRMMLAHLQAFMPASVPLIQAEFLLSMYEYSKRRFEKAFLSIGSCVRMSLLIGMDQNLAEQSDSERMENLRARSIWWSIVILERVIACDISRERRHISSIHPISTSHMHIKPNDLDQGFSQNESLLPQTSSWCKFDDETNGYGRAARSAWLLERVLKIVSLPLFDQLQQKELVALDTELLSHLKLDMARSCGNLYRGYCFSIGIGIQALFVLHNHTLKQIQGMSEHMQLQARTRAALDTITSLVVDAMDQHMSCLLLWTVEEVPPNCAYNLCAALDNIKRKDAEMFEDLEIPQSASFVDADTKVLRAMLAKLDRRWNIDKT